jgi:hypothetical protein
MCIYSTKVFEDLDLDPIIALCIGMHPQVQAHALTCYLVGLEP